METYLRPRRIRRLLKRKGSAEFYAGRGVWTTDKDLAKEFDSDLDLARVVQRYRLQGRCVVLLAFVKQQREVEVAL